MATAPKLDFASYVALKKSSKPAMPPAAEPAEPPAAEPDRPSQGPHPDLDYSYTFDRQSREAFERTKPVALAVKASVRLFKQLGQHQLLGNAVKVSDRQLPRIHGLVLAAAGALRMAPPEVFIVNNPTFNAATFGTNDDSFIILHSALVDHYADEELLCVLGHECGHIQSSHVAYLTALHYLTYMAGMFVPWILQPALVALRTWSRRAEITCDRSGMLAARDAAAAERAIAKLAVGSRSLYQEFNLEAFLEQHGEASSGVGKYMEVFASHPWLPKRVLAMRVFAESRLYRTAAGRAADGLTMSEVDSRVAALLKGDA